MHRLLFVCCALLFGCAESYDSGENPCREQVSARVTDVVDGDTLDAEILDGEAAGTIQRLRLLGVDTPEVDHNDEGNSECYGVLAWYESDDLIGEDVALTFDAECSDTFGRTLVYLFRRSDDLFWNEHLIREGFARTCPREPNSTFDTRFDAAQQSAIAESSGLWGECPDPGALGECGN